MLNFLSWDLVTAIVKWVGGGTLISFVLWLFKIPARLWTRIERRIVFKHRDIPRLTLMILVRSAEWNLGGWGETPATQLHFDLTLTNITNVSVEIVEATFTRRWRRNATPLTIYHNRVPADSVSHTGITAFIVPRVTNEPKPLRGTLCLVDQFQNKHRQGVTVMAGPDVVNQPKTAATLGSQAGM
jgi:hypothetical protein